VKRFIKIFGYTLAALFFIVALSGCGKSTSTTSVINIKVWSFEDADIWKPVIKQFQSDHAGYKIVYEKQTLDSDYENRVLNSVLSNQGPDVWNMPNDWVYRHKDKLLSISASAININNFVPSVGQTVDFGDKVYALSSYSEPLMIYYNDKIFQQRLSDFNKENPGSDNFYVRKEAARVLQGVPGTWTDFITTVNLLTIKDDAGNIEQSGVAMGTDQISNAQDILYLLMLQNGTKMTSDDLTQAIFNLPAQTPKETSDNPGLRAMEFYTSFANPSSENYSWDDSLGDDIDAFAEGKVAMIFGYSSLQNTLAQKYPDFRFKRTYVPQLTTETAGVVDYARFNAFGINSYSSSCKMVNKFNPCWVLLSSVATSGQSASFNSALKVYTSKKSTSTFEFNDRAGSNPEKVALSTAKSFVKGRYPIEFDANIRASIAAINQEGMDTQTALDSAANKITDLLRKGSW
jgi:ABC-type glycerol-3-phosphate transport system substrate-binding protein